MSTLHFHGLDHVLTLAHSMWFLAKITVSHNDYYTDITSQVQELQPYHNTYQLFKHGQLLSFLICAWPNVRKALRIAGTWATFKISVTIVLLRILGM